MTATLDLVHQPTVLYQSSIERIQAAKDAFERGDYVLTMYLSGLAVECILQAHALKKNPTHDAKHDLSKWLSRCETSLQNALKNADVRAHWNIVVKMWQNHLRYLSEDGLLGYLRRKELNRGIPGGPESIIKYNANSLLTSADEVHKKGVSAWFRYTRKS